MEGKLWAKRATTHLRDYLGCIQHYTTVKSNLKLASTVLLVLEERLEWLSVP